MSKPTTSRPRPAPLPGIPSLSLPPSRENIFPSSPVPSSSALPVPSPLPNTPNTPGHGFRAQIGSLLPRHALFQVRLHVDTLSNVPLVKGQFAVRWKFKNVQSGSGLFAKMRNVSGGAIPGGDVERERESGGGRLKKSFSKRGKWKGKGLDLGVDASMSAGGVDEHGVLRAGRPTSPQGPHIEVTSSHDDDDRGYGAEDDHTNEGDPETAKGNSYHAHHKYHHSHHHHDNKKENQPRRSSSSSLMYSSQITSSPDLDLLQPSRSSLDGPSISSPRISSDLSRPDPSHLASPLGLLSATPTITKATLSQMPGGSRLQTASRGHTDWVKLQNYNVTWDEKVNVVVQMDIHRETGDLLPNELKLVIMQRVVQGDPDNPKQPRLGAVYLNLAEYANAGVITRRYLLRESKTNATLKLTLELEHIAGTKQYKPPLLPKSEILAEVSGLLANNGLLRTRLARDLDLYSRSTVPMSTYSSHFDFSRVSSLHLPTASISNDASNETGNDDDSNFNRSSTSSPTPPPSVLAYSSTIPYTAKDGSVDYDTLAVMNGLHTTEHLIESIFNPVPTSSDAPSPFTYFDPVAAKVRETEFSAAFNRAYSVDSSSSSMGGGDTDSAHTNTSADAVSTGGSSGGCKPFHLSRRISENSQRSGVSRKTSYATSEHSSFISQDGSSQSVLAGTLQRTHWWQKITTPGSSHQQLPSGGSAATVGGRPNAPRLSSSSSDRGIGAALVSASVAAAIVAPPQTVR